MATTPAGNEVTGIDESSLEFRAWLASDFKHFTTYAWYKLGLPSPTPLQYDICDIIQDSTRPRVIIEAFRGCGKSFILSMFAIYQWLNNPNRRILVVSGSAKRANKFATMVRRALDSWTAIQYLAPKGDQRRSSVNFDVGPCEIDQTPSLSSVGLRGQLTGSRADLIIADDVETSQNSLTQVNRDQLSEAVMEFSNIVKPRAEGGRVVFLGTPQHEDSIYNILARERGYQCFVWPAKYPTLDTLDTYSGSLSPKYARNLIDVPGLVGAPTDPVRFDMQELALKEGEVGRSNFRMQFMLDTTLSDADRYPLKVSDLMVMPLEPDKCPLSFSYSASPDMVLPYLPSVGFAGDTYRKPYGLDNDYGLTEYQGSVMSIDPSGRGADEVGYAVVNQCNGKLFLMACSGLKGGYEDDTLTQLVNIAKSFKVNKIIIESNFGDGIFLKLFLPFVHRIYPCGVEELRHNMQKEARIIDTLEPVLNQHRMVVSEAVVVSDYNGTSRKDYQLFYQLTRITRERGALAHDDRLDALSMAVAFWIEHMAKDIHSEESRTIEEGLKAEMAKSFGGLITYDASPVSEPYARTTGLGVASLLGASGT